MTEVFVLHNTTNPSAIPIAPNESSSSHFPPNIPTIDSSDHPSDDPFPPVCPPSDERYGTKTDNKYFEYKKYTNATTFRGFTNAMRLVFIKHGDWDPYYIPGTSLIYNLIPMSTDMEFMRNGFLIDFGAPVIIRVFFEKQNGQYIIRNESNTQNHTTPVDWTSTKLQTIMRKTIMTLSEISSNPAVVAIELGFFGDYGMWLGDDMPPMYLQQRLIQWYQRYSFKVPIIAPITNATLLNRRTFKMWVWNDFFSTSSPIDLLPGEFLVARDFEFPVDPYIISNAIRKAQVYNVGLFDIWNSDAFKNVTIQELRKNIVKNIGPRMTFSKRMITVNHTVTLDLLLETSTGFPGDWNVSVLLFSQPPSKTVNQTLLHTKPLAKQDIRLSKYTQSQQRLQQIFKYSFTMPMSIKCLPKNYFFAVRISRCGASDLECTSTFLLDNANLIYQGWYLVPRWIDNLVPA